MSLLLAFLPELMDVWNTNRSQQWQQKRNNGVLEGIANRENKSTSSTLPIEAKVKLIIPTMGCVACVNKVDSSIRQCISAANNKIREEKSWLADNAAKGGMAELTVLGNTKEDINNIVEDVIAAVTVAGFECKVASIRVDEK